MLPIHEAVVPDIFNLATVFTLNVLAALEITTVISIRHKAITKTLFFSISLTSDQDIL